MTSANDCDMFVQNKIHFFNTIIANTLRHVSIQKELGILTTTDQQYNSTKCSEISQLLRDIDKESSNRELNISILQNVNNVLSAILKKFGTTHLDHLMDVCFGNIDAMKHVDVNKLEFLRNYFHPTSYIAVESTNIDKNTHGLDLHIDKNTATGDTFNIGNSQKLILTCFGMRLVIKKQKYLIITGYVDNINIQTINNIYLGTKYNEVTKCLGAKNPKDQVELRHHSRFLQMTACRDFMVRSVDDFVTLYSTMVSDISALKLKGIQYIIKEFFASDLIKKRYILIALLIDETQENINLIFMLYDLLSNDSNGNVDNLEQLKLVHTFPNIMKDLFVESLKTSIEYSSNIIKCLDKTRIPLEQQISLMRSSEDVKEKAMSKLKEVKNKSEDSCNKAKQYLEGLLRIPFGVNRREHILRNIDSLKTLFSKWKETHGGVTHKHSNAEMHSEINETLRNSVNSSYLQQIFVGIDFIDKKRLSVIYADLLTHCMSVCIDCTEINKFNKKTLSPAIKQLLLTYFEKDKIACFNYLYHLHDELLNHAQTEFNHFAQLKPMLDKFSEITEYFKTVDETLDNCVHGHTSAKRQIKRIVGQWISGDNSKGYCIGFEGPPGVGKTTLAKEGLSRILQDDDGTYRPFSLIQLGGDSNGSSLSGHGYTYVGSTWGSIVQILMDKKCMNPIILIDEVDKISKTEHGRELIGILTHMLDPSQNDSFQDKYFSGINIDLSHVLFILSYNDPNEIDKILLDRVHRITFEPLSIAEKIHVSKNNLIPFYETMFGLQNAFVFEDGVLELLIDKYTQESGIRKLKELLYAIIGEINLEVLTNSAHTTFPRIIKPDDIQHKYLPDKHPINNQLIHRDDAVGIINCLFATTSGHSGILAATAKLVYSEKIFDLKLTGLLDEMMKESFHIAFTLAYGLLCDDHKQKLNSTHNETKNVGIHMHMGDGSINKSGTSAGIAITVLLYSLLSDRKIKHDFAITGEAADLSGTVGEIGALKHKFLGGIKAGVKHFIFPQQNFQDYIAFITKNENNPLIQGVTFHPVSHISEVLDLIIV